MNGTSGQIRIKELEPQKDIYIRSKDGPRMGTRIYTEKELEDYIDSGMQFIFEKQSYDLDTNPNFESTFKMLLDRGLKKIIVNGFATDYCDKAAVLAMAKYKEKYNSDLEIYLVTDAIEEVNIDFEGMLREFKPNIYFGGTTAAFWGSMSWTIIFGLTFATFLTLIIIPSMYHMLYKVKLWGIRIFKKNEHQLY